MLPTGAKTEGKLIISVEEIQHIKEMAESIQGCLETENNNFERNMREKSNLEDRIEKLKAKKKAEGGQ